MEANKAVIGAIIFIVLIVGANFVMYAIARGAARPNQKGLLETMIKSFSRSPQKKGDSMDELRQKMEELKERRGDDTADSE
jgi:hypothetical protein